MNIRTPTIALLLAALGSTAQADVDKVSATGFTVQFREELQATPEAAWKAMVQPQHWWDGQHTFSGKAANLSLQTEAGGCWCERWGDGASVMHGQVTWVQPGRGIRLNAWLGPMQELAVAGVLTMVASAQDGKTMLRMTYRVAGSADAGLEAWAPRVDQVMATQYRRLKALIEKGKVE